MPSVWTCRHCCSGRRRRGKDSRTACGSPSGCAAVLPLLLLPSTLVDSWKWHKSISNLAGSPTPIYRVFDVILANTISDYARSWCGLLGTAFATVIKPFRKKKELEGFSTKRVVLASFLSGIQALVLVIILCSVAVLYMFGIYISAGVGMWRLIEHDFSNADGAANLKPALQVLYSLVVAQGLVYVYKTIHAFGAKFGLAEFAAEQLGSMDKDLVSSYLEDTVAGCEKDPSFATGRNLVTYAVDLMMDDAKSIDRYMNGVKILGAAIGKEDTFGNHDRMELAKHLLTRPSYSFSQMIQRLLETLGPRSPYSRKIRANAAGIVAIVASSIHLEDHPVWIDCISSLLETFEEYSWRPEEYSWRPIFLRKEYERGWLLKAYEEYPLLFFGGGEKSTVDRNHLRDDYLRLVRQGIEILRELAVYQANCRVIINAEGLLQKITAPLSSKQPHRDQHDEWASVAVGSLKLMMQLAANPGETGTKVQDEISRSSKAIITTLESILESQECNVVLKISTVDIVLHLSVNTSSINASGRCDRIFNWILLLIFLLPYNEVRRFKTRMKISSDTRRLAGEKKISSNQELPLQQSVVFVLGDLTAALVNAGDISTRVHAAKILKHLWDRYRKDYEYLEELKKVMVAVMPEVLKQILGRGWTREAATEAANNVQSSFQGNDIEIGGVSGGEGCEPTSSSQQQTGDETEDIKLRKELTSLCETIYFSLYRGWINVTQLDEIAERLCSEQRKPVKTFEELLKEGREILEKTTAKEG